LQKFFKTLTNYEPFLKLDKFNAIQDTGIHEVGVFCWREQCMTTGPPSLNV